MTGAGARIDAHQAVALRILNATGGLVLDDQDGKMVTDRRKGVEVMFTASQWAAMIAAGLFVHDAATDDWALSERGQAALEAHTRLAAAHERNGLKLEGTTP